MTCLWMTCLRCLRRRGASLATAAVPALLASACALPVPPDPGRVTAEAQPRTPVVRNITSFTHALRCMDDLLRSYGKADIVITSDGLPDKTGQITTGTKEMMISAVSRMSARSGAFRFVDVDRTQDSVFWIQENWIGVRDGLRAPNYYIRGAITQVDAGVMTDSASTGASIPWLSLGKSRDQLVSVVSMDLNIGDVVTRQIVPGLSSTNSIAVVKTGRGQDTEGLIDKAGIFFEVSGDRSQGSHQSVRTLVELGLVEVLGKLTRVPYWRCLQIDSTNPEMIAEARDWFDRMDRAQRVRLVQDGLRRYGIFQGEADGESSRALDNAVSRYQDENDLIANGRIDFDLYYSLLANDLAIGNEVAEASELTAQRPEAGSAPGPAAGSAPPPSPSRGDIGLRVDVDGGRNRDLRRGDSLRLVVTVAEDARVYCYYQDHEGVVVRVFPSRFQEDARVAAGTWVQIPDRDAGYEIVLEQEDAFEQVACIATRVAYGAKRPFVLDEGDLQALSVPDLASAVEQHLEADRFESTVQYLPIRVRAAPMASAEPEAQFQ